MTYLLRVLLPDVPGSLGFLAAALGEAGGDIRSVDVIAYHEDRTVVDDIVVDLETPTPPDALISAARSVGDIEVDSIRPYSGTTNRRGETRMLAELAGDRRQPKRALQAFVDALPRTMTAGWAIVLDHDDVGTRRLAASSASPEDDGRVLSEPPVDSPRGLDAEAEDWIPDSWTVMESSLAAAPMGNDRVLIIGRPGGPDFLPCEVQHLGDLGTIIGAIVD
ncbi:amino acid-binding ACT domain protein [Corynebacterium sp. TAE3-ERU12]|uniref:amino acid-binding ACT domain protein n=1 Tax=Corynebacterium sp. TAE3-ERU12 TaxID=2849491 RepID=UPI001C48082B|nr:amino acid-binding ACT domain protein [Corynebacterium sp. TAE3-ERU12]MBV7295135.1 amino acid-binding ACT domain protein [Corynebacterium sp. TAE3-ERU12]